MGEKIRFSHHSSCIMPNENVTAIQSPEAHTTGVAVAYKESDPLAGLRAVALSGPFLGAVGSTIITVPVTTVGAIGFGITGIWTAINEFRSATRSSCAPHPMDISDTPRNHGLLGLLRELVQCPGLAPIVQGSCFLYSAVMACAQGQEFVGSIFVVFAMGECAAARIGNLGYKRLPRQPLGIEELLANQWQLMPERVKVILMDPGVYFCTGNLALILAQFESQSFHQVYKSPLTLSAFTFGLSFSTAGLTRGLLPLTNGSETKPSGAASILGGLGDLVLGTLSVLFGNAYTGFATIAWGTSNILYGLKMGIRHPIPSSE